MTLKRSLTFVVGAIAVLCVGYLLAAQPSIALATESATSRITTGLDLAADGSYDQSLSAPTFIGNLIRGLLGVTGVVFLVITIYAGILYLTAAGSEDKIKKAKSMLTSSLIGLILIVGAYALSSYVIALLSEAASGTRSAG